jgi:hypothetical protein
LPIFQDYTSIYVEVISSTRINLRKTKEKQKKNEDPYIETSLDFFLRKDLYLGLERNSHTSNHASTKCNSLIFIFFYLEQVLIKALLHKAPVVFHRSSTCHVVASNARAQLPRLLESLAHPFFTHEHSVINVVILHCVGDAS